MNIFNRSEKLSVCLLVQLDILWKVKEKLNALVYFLLCSVCSLLNLYVKRFLCDRHSKTLKMHNVKRNIYTCVCVYGAHTVRLDVIWSSAQLLSWESTKQNEVSQRRKAFKVSMCTYAFMWDIFPFTLSEVFRLKSVIRRRRFCVRLMHICVKGIDMLN